MIRSVQYTSTYYNPVKSLHAQQNPLQTSIRKQQVSFGANVVCRPHDKSEIINGLEKLYRSYNYQEKQKYFGKTPLNADEFFSQMVKMFEEAIPQEGTLRIEPKDNGVHFLFIFPDGKLVIPPKATPYDDLVGDKEPGPDILSPLCDLAAGIGFQLPSAFIMKDKREIIEGLKKFYKSCKDQEKQKYFGEGPLDTAKFFSQMGKMFKEVIPKGTIILQPKDEGVRFSYLSPEGITVIPQRAFSYLNLVGGKKEWPYIRLPLFDLIQASAMQLFSANNMFINAYYHFYPEYRR